MLFPFTRLCLNGGGMRGILQLGALDRIEQTVDQPLYKVFHRGMYGVSIGAVTTSLLAFGYTVAEIKNSLHVLLNLQSTLSPIRLETLMRIPSQKGIDDGKQLKETLSKIFQQKGLQFDTMRVGDALCPLRIYGSDLTNLKPVVFNEDVLLWDAIRATTSIPFVFTPHIIKGRVFVDGGVMVSNIMPHLTERQRKRSLHIYCSREQGIKDPREMTFGQYSAYVMNAGSTRDHFAWAEKYPHNMCILQNNSIQALDFGKVKEKSSEYLAYGFDTMQSFLDQVPLSRTFSTR